MTTTRDYHKAGTSGLVVRVMREVHDSRTDTWEVEQVGTSQEYPTLAKAKRAARDRLAKVDPASNPWASITPGQWQADEFDDRAWGHVWDAMWVETDDPTHWELVSGRLVEQ